MKPFPLLLVELKAIEDLMAAIDGLELVGLSGIEMAQPLLLFHFIFIDDLC